mmetsp:Transcript_6632/g.11685  ORF Transcript_6632/g.11685 Transcript_6632/m.11685 type:complete len:150 (+) Transcript_6632:92-541(+)
MAAYLVFDVANLGQLLMHWSEEPVEGALAVIHPGKPVPKFKFKQRGGRIELVRKIREDLAKMYEGYAEFIKTAKTVDGTFEMLEPTVNVTFNNGGNIVHCEPGETYPISDFHGVAVCGLHKNPYESVKTMGNGQFLSHGIEGKGHALAL